MQRCIVQGPRHVKIKVSLAREQVTKSRPRASAILSSAPELLGFAMFPIGGPLPVLVGELTPEMQEKLRKIRFCVMGTFLAAIGRFCTGDIPVSELLCGIVGIFLLNEDPNVAPCYACLASSPLGQCSMGHGLSCCLTYSFLAAMNSIFLMLKLLTGGPFVLVSFCCQASGAFLAMKLNALVSREELLGEPDEKSCQQTVLRGRLKQLAR